MQVENGYDVTDPAATSLISSTAYAGAGYTHQGWITADHRYFLLDDELDDDEPDRDLDEDDEEDDDDEDEDEDTDLNSTW